MNTTALEKLVKSARDDFILAKSDGKLDAGEIIQIGMKVAQGLQSFVGLSGAEKKALVLLTLKQGLKAAGGLPGLEGATSEVIMKFEEQAFSAVNAAIDLAVGVAHGKIDLRKPSAWKACLPFCSAAVAVLLPKDKQYLQEALGSIVGPIVSSIQESQTPSEVEGSAAAAAAATAAEAQPSEIKEDKTPSIQDEKGHSPQGVFLEEIVEKKEE